MFVEQTGETNDICQEFALCKGKKCYVLKHANFWNFYVLNSLKLLPICNFGELHGDIFILWRNLCY